jgi:hypothetical protein
VLSALRYMHELVHLACSAYHSLSCSSTLPAHFVAVQTANTGCITRAGAHKDARPIKVMLAEEVPPGADNLRSNNVGVHHEMDPAARGHMPQQVHAMLERQVSQQHQKDTSYEATWRATCE